MDLSNQKHWSKLQVKEKIKAYEYAVNTGDVIDTFEGFCKWMQNSIIDVSNGKPVEIA